MRRTANIVIRVSPAEKKKLEALARGLTFSHVGTGFVYPPPGKAVEYGFHIKSTSSNMFL
jgi:hypothetical protein